MIAGAAHALLRVLSIFVGEAAAERVVGRWYAISVLVYFQLATQYGKAMLGLLWVVLTPMLFLGVYLTVFRHFSIMEGLNEADPLAVPFYIVAGFLAWSAFADGFLQGASSIAHNPAVVQNSPTPPGFLPLVKVTTAFAGFLFTLMLFVVVLTVLGRFPGVRLVLLPAAFVLLYLFTLGLVWGVSSIAVYVRDLLQLLPTLLLIEFFACPVTYSLKVMDSVSPVLRLNPLTAFLSLFRAALAPDAPFAWHDLMFAVIWTLGALVVGGAVFRRLEDGFCDAL